MDDFKRRELIEAYNSICKDKYGRRVLLDLLDFCALYITASESTEGLWLREGQKSVATYLISRLQEADYKNYPELLMHRATEMHEEDLRRKSEEKNDG